MPAQPIVDAGGIPVALGEKVAVEFLVKAVHSTLDANTLDLESTLGTPPGGTKVLLTVSPVQVAKVVPPPPPPDTGIITALENENRSLRAERDSLLAAKKTASGISLVAKVTTPSPGSSVRGMASVAATASGPSPIASVQFQVDGSNSGAALTKEPFATTVDVSKAPNGPHSIGVVATDTQGATAGDSISVTVAN